VEQLPHWQRGTPGVLCVSGPHAIPVSTAVRASGERLLLALGRKRETLRRLRQEDRVAFCVLGAELAFTAYGRARVVRERLAAADTAVAVELRVERLQDHLADGRTEMLDGARWRWTQQRWAKSEAAILAELERLATGE
jgi:hypothetical protein